MNGGRWLSALVAALALVLAPVPPAGAQSSGATTRGDAVRLAQTAPSFGFAPSNGPGPVITPRALPNPVTAPIRTPPSPPANPAHDKTTLSLSARYGSDGPPINAGLVWRVFPAKPNQAGAFHEVKQDKEAAPSLLLPEGDYVVHVAFGLASAAKAVRLHGQPVHEVFNLAAGGLRIEGRVGDVRIPTSQITFDIFKGSQFDPGDKRPIAHDVLTGQVVLVPEGTYNIVSNYGDGNSVVRSDIRVQAGKLTDVTVTHRAALITLKLVDKAGGEALANTQWSVLTPGGDVIKESIGAFPRVVLAEGAYRAIARNEGKTYERTFKVITGVDGDVEVLAR